MHLLAGIHIAWSTVYLIMGVTILTIWLRFGQTRTYLLFSLICLELLVFSIARTSFYLQGGSQPGVLSGQILMAMLPAATGTMASAAAWRAEVRGRRWLLLFGLTHTVSFFFLVSCLAGWCLDYSHVVEQTFHLLVMQGTLHEYSLSPLGYALAFYSLALALFACVQLMKGYRDDPVIRIFFVISFGCLALATINDVLLQAKIIASVYLVEHCIFFVILCVFMGFLREFERSRQQLQKRTEELEEANRRLESLAEDLSESLDRLERAHDETRRLRPMADLGRLSASLAHEIRNPLAVLTNVSSTLARHGGGEGDREEYESLLTMMKEETNRLARLVEDLLLFSQTGRLSREPVDPGLLLQTAAADVQEQFHESDGYRIEIRREDELPAFPGSFDSIRRALVNLLVNAMQSSTADKTVRILARRGGDRQERLMIGVEDRAGGVPTEEISEIFEPFFSTRTTGTGLGLPIVKSIVEAHQGELSLENAPGVGATFWMALPVVEQRPSREK